MPSTPQAINPQLIAILARAAGLDKALTEFPEDVAAAAEQGFGNTGIIRYPASPADEPWPPMRAGVGL